MTTDKDTNVELLRKLNFTPVARVHESLGQFAWEIHDVGLSRSERGLPDPLTARWFCECGAVLRDIHSSHSACMHLGRVLLGASPRTVYSKEAPPLAPLYVSASCRSISYHVQLLPAADEINLPGVQAYCALMGL